MNPGLATALLGLFLSAEILPACVADVAEPTLDKRDDESWDWFVNEAETQNQPAAVDLQDDEFDWNWNGQDQDQENQNEGVKSKEQEIAPDDIMMQFFNHPGDQPLQQIVDWNDRDFLKEEAEAEAMNQGNQWENVMVVETEEDDNKNDWNNWNNAIPQKDVFEQATWQEQSENTVNNKPSQDSGWLKSPNEVLQEKMSFGGFYGVQQPSLHNADTESLWNELKTVQEQNHIPSIQESISKQIDDVNKQMKAVAQKLKELQKRLNKEGNLSLCLTEVCKPCEIKEVCVERDDAGNCLVTDVKRKQCCNKEYEPQCVQMKEAQSESIQKEIEKATTELARLEDELQKLIQRQKEADKDILHPTLE